jgi:hypothetical protein
MGLALTITENNGHISLCDAKSIGYFGLGHCPTQGSDLGHFIGGQEFLEQSDTTDVYGVLPVQVVGGPFEVGDDIVRFDTVNVVHHWVVGGIWNEGETNKSMNMDGLAFPISTKIDVSISKFVSARAQNFSVDSSCLNPVTDTIKAANSSEIADLVKITEVFDRNRSPFFCEDDIHSMGCLSGECGLAIKSPLDVLAYGGLAFMAPASTFYNTLQ